MKRDTFQQENQFTQAKTLTILRTAAGSAPTVSQYQKFRELGLRVVGADANPLSVGFFFADAAYQVPRADSLDYVEVLLTICEQEGVDWVLPAIDEELLKLVVACNLFEEIGTRLLLSGIETIRICTDKLATYQFFLKHEIPTPQTLDATQIEDPTCIEPYPQIVKPRFGRGSTGMYVGRNWDEVAFFSKYVSNAVVQSYICGAEFTVDVLADYDSEPVIVAPRRRLATDSGISYKGATAWHAEIIDWVCVIVRALHLVGPANIQCFVNEQGQVLFTEVNARLAGSSILSVAAGVPLLEGIISMLRGESPPHHIQPVNELVMLRYWSEIFLPLRKATRFGWKP